MKKTKQDAEIENGGCVCVGGATQEGETIRVYCSELKSIK